MRTLRVLCVLGIVGAISTLALAAKPEARPRREKPAMKLAASAYSFHKFTFADAVEKTKELRLKYIEGFSWQKIAPGADAELNVKAPADAVAKAKATLAKDGVEMTSYYVNDFGAGEPEARKVFELAQKLGVKVLVSEPKPEMLGMLDKLCQEFDMDLAIHNHPKNPKDAKYENWDPEHVMKMLQIHSNHLGCCVDTGHWVRSGLDPVECLKKCRGRLTEVHMKDVDKKGPDAKDVPFGTGVGNIKGVIDELKAQRFVGPVVLEYESNLDNNIGDLRECIKYFNQTASGEKEAAGEKAAVQKKPAAKAK
jgi:sugar phosphate isomerase/epimerase